MPPRTPQGNSTPPPAGAGRVSYLYQRLREDILALRLRSGETLDETTLAEHYGAQGGAVREALVKLQVEGLVELLADRGARVTQLDFAELPRFIEAIDLVSRAINRYAAERRSEVNLAAIENAAKLFDVEADAGDASALAERNRSFHMAVAHAADNGYLQDLYARLFDQGTRVMHLALGRARQDRAQQSRHLERVSADHAALVDAIRSQDGDEAEAVARSHTALFRERVYEYLKLESGGDVEVRPS